MVHEIRQYFQKTVITKIARFKQNTLEASFGAVSIKDIQPIVDPTRVQSTRRRPNVDPTIFFFIVNMRVTWKHQ